MAGLGLEPRVSVAQRPCSEQCFCSTGAVWEGGQVGTVGCLVGQKGKGTIYAYFIVLTSPDPAGNHNSETSSCHIFSCEGEHAHTHTLGSATHPLSPEVPLPVPQTLPELLTCTLDTHTDHLITCLGNESRNYCDDYASKAVTRVDFLLCSLHF